jgi:HEAT repeat protein
MISMRTLRYIAIWIILLWMSVQSEAQVPQSKIDSLIPLFVSAGRNWDIYADQFISIGEPAVPSLLNLLQDTTQTPWVRRTAAMTLNDIHSPAYVSPALKLLLDRSEPLELRNQVTHGLRGYDLSKAAGALYKMFEEEEDQEFLRLNIAGLLSSSDPTLAYRAYRELYTRSGGYCKQQALVNLVRLHPDESGDWFLDALQEDDWMTGNLAMDSLSVIEDYNPGKLIRLYYRSSTPEMVRWRIIHVMGRRHRQNHLSLFMDALSDPGWLVHNEAALVLSRSDAEKVIADLRFLEQSGVPELAERAGWVIRQFEEDADLKEPSMQPYDGYPLLDDLDEIKDLLKDKCVDTISFRRGEVIADVGAGNGYLVAMLSLFHDDLTFYIQDIDSDVCNPAQFKAVKDFYEEVNGGPFTSDYFIVNGTDTESNLPDHTLDKILMLWTYQYLKYPKEFITDLRGKLKNEGLLYVINPDQDYEYGKLLFMEFGWNSSTIENQISDIIQCGFELLRVSRNWEDNQKPYIMVFKKK